MRTCSGLWTLDSVLDTRGFGLWPLPLVTPIWPKLGCSPSAVVSWLFTRQPGNKTNAIKAKELELKWEGEEWK